MLINIQLLRMLAAMMVVFYHTSVHVRASGVAQGGFFEVMEAVGFAGVDIFFVISGFIMAHTSFAASGPQDAWSFLRRRLARIYSGYWPFFLLALIIFSWVNPALLHKAKLLQSVILWPAYPLLIAVSWTLIFELFFYLLFTLIISISDRRRSLLLHGLFVLMLGYSLYSQFVLHTYAKGNLETITAAEYCMFSPYLMEFLGGAVLAGWLRGQAGKPASRQVEYRNFFLLGSGCALFLFAGWINNHWFDGAIEQGYTVFYRVLVFGAPSLLILASLVRLEQNGRHAPKRFSLLTGAASYAIYLSHGLILAITQKLGFNEFAGSLGGWTMQALYITLVAAILGYSVLHFRMIEQPLHQIFKRGLRLQVRTRSDAPTTSPL
ncbi:MAG TPA: acyltransferase [Dokdonella sp.]|uniref:acyltransferase family protein n=1 Tax=Dokdonella sp. TaxID=2291710 RepID=UPI002D7FE29E|nr:acyltransferase [Dokdonella sp.]HET9032972.1 acyltransferase [Dokdonella sp.]